MAVNIAEANIQQLSTITGVDEYLEDLGRASSHSLRHSERVAGYVTDIASEVLRFDERQVALIGLCAITHDLGKRRPDIAELVNKGSYDQLDDNTGTDELTDEERQVVDTHSLVGAVDLDELSQGKPPEIYSILQVASYVALNHHSPMKNSTGRGAITYLISLADKYDATQSTEPRPYPIRSKNGVGRPEPEELIPEADIMLNDGKDPVVFGVPALAIMGYFKSVQGSIEEAQFTGHGAISGLV